MRISKDLLRLGIVNIFGILQLTTARTYFVIFLEEDLLIEILIVSALLTIQNFSQIFLRIPLSKMSQVVGRKPLILTGIFSFSFSLLFLALADSWIYGLFSVIFISIGMSAYWPSIFAYIGDISEKGGKVGEMNGRIFQFGDIGQLAAAGLASYLLSANTLIGALTLSELYQVFVVIGFLSSIACIFILKETLPNENRLQVNNKVKEFLQSIVKVLSDFLSTSRLPGLLPIYLMQFGIAFVEFGFTSFYPSLLSKFGYLDAEIADLVLFSTLALFLFKPQLGNVSDRFGYRIPVILGFVLIAGSLLAMALFNNFWVHLVSISLILAAMVVHYSAMNGHTATTAPITKRGMAMGTLGVYTSLGRALSTLVIGWLTSIGDIFSAFSIFAGITMLIGIAFYLTQRD